ncbi:TonB-dependent receptor [Myroides profundi]|uniref:Iron complex outermembrane recepter protein n=1 Tax=Myroides profundi TaxID=480520 RepID=A0AAJ4W4U8_MYRPR|nr:TonB-dependent receptor [Myroides profundi]SER11560.1 iron complex outermembrane recepter protein [Myroides profundi]
MKRITTLIFTIGGVIASIAQVSTIKGRIVDSANKPIPFVSVLAENNNKYAETNENGDFVLEAIPKGKVLLKIMSIGYSSLEKKVNVHKEEESYHFTMTSDSQLENITVYGKSNKDVKKLEYITRLPLGIQDQVLAISIVPGEVIKEQGALTITEASRNVAGVTQFATYGTPFESMSIRGFRGTPVLRNGVAMESDFRRGSGIADMQGIESVEVIKGSAAVIQGIGNGLGAVGGVINLVTKTPNFYNKREVGFRTGSYGHIRPTVDIEQVLDKKETLSLRFNGSYERNDGWRTYVNNNHYYINPSLAWKINDKTKLTVEMDFLEGDYTVDKGTENIGPDYVNRLYKLPHNKFLGFKEDNMHLKSLNYVARFERQLSDKLSMRVSSLNSITDTDLEDSALGLLKRQNQITDWKEFELRERTIGKSVKSDRSTAIQVDFIGKDVFTGALKHTFQLGFDFREYKTKTTNYDGYVGGKLFKETINVLGEVNNNRPEGLEFRMTSRKGGVLADETSPTYGFMAQDYIQIGDKLSAMLGIRYSRLNGINVKDVTVARWNPAVGLVFKPQENISTFISYTTTTSLKQANYKMADGGFAGAADTKQIEFGFKTNWLNDHLGVNFTYFFINQDNLLYEVFDENNQRTNTYLRAGDLRRNGFELEINGKITNNLEVMLGYANLLARYQDSPNYVDGSAPMNTPEHTANGWANYKFDQGVLKGFSVGMGVYFVGKRPVNEYARASDGHGSYENVRPFDMPDYTTFNMQLGYTYKNARIKLYANNIFDKLGYNSYFRAGYINEIAPRNIAAQLLYSF